MSKTILAVTEDLMRFHTTADRPVEIARAVQYVKDYFAGVPEITIREYESAGKPSLVISFDDSLAPDIMLVGHLDVVPAADELFVPRVEAGRLYGRGSCDMKSEIAVMLELMRDCAPTRPSVALMIGCDEESGGMNGVGYLVNTIGYRTRVALVPDGGESLEKVVLKSKGVLHITVSAAGHAAHGSRPWLGENAIEKLFGVYKEIHALFPATEDPERWYSTCVLGKFSGGIVVNQVPDSASCDIDIRFAEDIAPEALLARVRDCVGDAARVDLLCSGKYADTSFQNPYVQAYSAAVRDLLHTELTEEISHGATDGRFFSELGIPVITSRPLSDGQHTPNEWVSIESLEPFKKLYADAIKRFASLSQESDLSTSNLTVAAHEATLD